jgi:8-oxo-dGTP pyrophosphatase MutT (NUDIX family)
VKSQSVGGSNCALLGWHDAQRQPTAKVPNLTAELDLGRVRAVLTQTRQVPPATDPHATESVQAAVAALLSPQAPLNLLLIRRAQHEHDPWSAHMAFPGGKRDSNDRTLLETARRETLEEIGVDLDLGAEFLGRLPEQRLDRGQSLRLTVQPFVYALTREPVFKTNHEVEKVVWLPLDGLTAGSRDTTLVHEYRGNRMVFPAWDLDGDKIWGLTYRMIQSLFDLLEDA